jgi:hypothetical protein
MTKQLLIYERATPISSNHHRDVSIKFGGDFGFAKDINSAPLMAVEFEPASVEYTIVFVGDASGVMPAALLGVRDHENLYVDENGAWNAKYLPAFIRRYPFVFSSVDNQRFTLCLDEEFHGVNRKGQGERLFDADGEITQYLQNVFNFLQAYQAQYEATRAFVQRILDLGLLESAKAHYTLQTGQTITLGGFMTVNRARLRSLPGDDLARLASAGDLDLVYAHLASQHNFAPTADRILRVAAPVPAVAETAPAWPR